VEKEVRKKTTRIVFWGKAIVEKKKEKQVKGESSRGGKDGSGIPEVAIWKERLSK